MPPKKKGVAAASPAAKKRSTAPGKRAPAKKRQDSEGAAASASDQAGDPPATAEDLTEAAATADDVAVLEEVSGPVDRAAVAMEEGFDAAAETEEATAAVMAVHRHAPAATTAALKGEEIDGLVGSEEGATVVTKVEVEEEMDAAAGLSGKVQDPYVAEEEMECGGAGVETMAAAEDAAAKGVDGTASQEQETVSKMEMGGGPASGQEELSTAGMPPSSTASGVGSLLASTPAKLPASLPLQTGPPFHSLSHSVDELRGLSTVLSSFIRCWDSLSEHLGSIQASMDALSQVGGTLRRPLPLATQGTRMQKEEMMARVADERKEGAGVGEVAAEEKDTTDTGRTERAKEAEQPQKEPPLDLESICEKMLGRNLRRYVVAHMSDVNGLREEVPRALRLAPNPAKLVLSCIGRFYLQGSRAYADSNSPMVSVRRACILVLEFFLLSGCLLTGGVHLSSSSGDASYATVGMEVAEGKEEATASIVEEAKVAAVAWKNRLVAEGGIASASAVDALGLALFVASFGIPPDFDSEMMYDVFRLCNMKKKADILRQSPIIVEKLPDIIQDLVQKEKYMAAADLACGFGLQEKYPPLDLISSFLIKNTAAEEERMEGQSSVRLLREEAAGQLAAYKSVVRCVEEYKLDPSSLISFKIEENISRLEKDVSKFEKKLKDINLKRKAEDVELSNEVRGPAKRPASKTVKATSGSAMSRAKATQDHGRALSLSRNLYASSSNSFFGLLDGGGVGNLSGNVLGPRGAGSMLAANTSLFAGGGYSVGSGILPSAESRVPYGWRLEGALGDNSIGQTYLGMEHYGQKGLVGPPSAENLHQLQASTLGMGSRAVGSNLYGFADNVIENELYYGGLVRSNGLSSSASGYR